LLNYLIWLFGAIWVCVATMFMWVLAAGIGLLDAWPIGFGIWAFCGVMALVCWGIKVNRGMGG